MSVKSHLSAGFRFHEGKLMNLQPSPDPNRTFLFEHLIGTYMWLKLTLCCLLVFE